MNEEQRSISISIFEIVDIPFQLPREDLDHILASTEDIFHSLNGSRIFITGGTGFIGRWLLASLLHARVESGVKLSVDVLTRNPDFTLARWPVEFAEGQLRLISGDITQPLELDSNPDYVIHGAADTSTYLSPQEVGNAIIRGTRNIGSFAANTNVDRLLFLSSGAVYDDLGLHTPFFEAQLNSPEHGLEITDYGTSKQLSETMLNSVPNISVVSARCFAFVGPYLPLDQNFAIGNFIADSLNNRKTIIRGDGLGVRSYMYTSDLVIWLWELLLKGEADTAYNVGSSMETTIAALAHTVAKVTGNSRGVSIQNREKSSHRSYYVPDVSRARDLDLDIDINLETAIDKTAKWAATHSDWM
ncbi:MAG: NAD(P)-dependent oxidoreductase [Gammaproteobacteria bacterium]|nr:NAD(P)-dependent oxidoreductase [Gammaproteobacteria bacterium]